MKPLIWAEIDLGAIADNVRALRRLTDPRAKVMAVVKADGYGHGACEVARAALAAGAEWLGVARLHEAVRLRESGLAAPLMVLGYTPLEDAERLVEFDLRQSVYSLAAAEAYSAAAGRRGGRIRVHVKVDTGMGRLGLVPAVLAGGDAGDPVGDGLIRTAQAIARLPGLEAEGIFTHFAASDSADKTHARGQLRLFVEVLDTAAEERPGVRRAPCSEQRSRDRPARVALRPRAARDRALWPTGPRTRWTSAASASPRP